VADILVIGYGNELRRDDRIGLHVARTIARENYANVRVVTCSQLVPELAADLAESRLAVFVDALADPTRNFVELQRISAEQRTDWSAHNADPRSLLALTHAVYGRVPEAWWVLVAGEDFGFGEGLSVHGKANAREAIHLIASLMKRINDD
jgi:hydrogenase maturation protease